jgi:S1-C subfamily serine protease
VTNYHVVRNARSAQIAIISPNSKSASGVVTLAQQKSTDDEEIFNVFRSPAEIRSASRKAFSPNYQRSVYKAKVVGVDPGKDIAVLKVEVEDPDILFPITVGTSTGE